MATPKSKDAKRKLRRWTFVVSATREGGDTKFFEPPALTIGDSQAARSAAAEIKRDVETLPNLAGAKIKVEPKGHETISQAILNQIKGLEDQATLLTRALKAAIEKYLTENLLNTGQDLKGEAREKEVTKLLGMFVAEQQEEMVKDRMRAMGIDPDQVVNDPIDPVADLSIPVNIHAESTEEEEVEEAA